MRALFFMRQRLRLASYLICTLVAFLTLGSAPRCPVARARDLCPGVIVVASSGDSAPD